MIGRRTSIARPRGATAAPLVQAQLITAHAGYGPSAKVAPSSAAQTTQTSFASQSDGVNTARIFDNGKDMWAESGFGNGAKKYNASQLNWIMSRGASGGSLSKQDQAVYDRMMYLRAQNVVAAQKEAEDQKAAEAAAAKRRQEMGDKLFSSAFQQGLNGKDIGAMDDAEKLKLSDNAMAIAAAALKRLSSEDW